MALVEIDKLDVLVLKKLVLVNHMLAKQISGSAGREQMAMTKVLNEITLRADAANTVERSARMTIEPGVK